MTETRIKVEDILEASKGMLQKQLYVVFTSPTKGLGPVMENIGPHLKYQVELEEKGIMCGAGPFWTDDEQAWEGEGLVIGNGTVRGDVYVMSLGPKSRERCAAPAFGCRSTRSRATR